MDGFELFQLGRTLMRLGEQSMPETGFRQLSGPARTVLFDIAENPDSSISEITARVRFPQSQVSACVTRLRDDGVVETAADPLDRRRTLVRLTAAALRRTGARPPANIDAALANAMRDLDPVRVERTKAVLNELVGLLHPPDRE
ncbi:DNA-binding MarR family transcriptional regulator [Actinocorallia herbida]|uniref:DNA-binding MarR family transcriptional regulator n=1 Tax=Actinocorallia herbida TaxID=58109 RepID=A0A3N1D1D1_9ACTN|nr:MarR family transcriptional regulator [Actinocorallia herbida]ROO87321.1 DNA-binding MarR family transcriptional regulator [Actinocorallia herbida]